MFFTIEVRDDYHHSRNSEEELYETAVSTKYGDYEYKLVPFGLTSAPSAFTNIMNDVFRDYYSSFLVAHVDNTLVSRNSWEKLTVRESRLRKFKLHEKL